MRDENSFDFSYAIITKDNNSVVIILKDSEIGIFDYDSLQRDDFIYKYLLLKHYSDSSVAHKDFLKLIGKMCAKKNNSKYFDNKKDEDNRMISDIFGSRIINTTELLSYRQRYDDFKNTVLEYRYKI